MQLTIDLEKCEVSDDQGFQGEVFGRRIRSSLPAERTRRHRSHFAA